MPTRRFFALSAFAAVLFVPAVQAWSWGSGERITGTGEAVAETRALSDFEGVGLSGDFRVIVRQGATFRVEVKAERNLLPYLETRVVDGSKGRSLEIGVKRGFHVVSAVGPTVTVELPVLRAVSVAGSGKINVEAFKTASLDVAIAGSGDIRLQGLDADAVSMNVSGSGDIGAQGRAGRSSLSIAGSGDIKSADLVAEEVKVSIAGSGDARVHATQKLKVSIAGSGDVRYRGSPEISRSVAGSGSVKPLND